MKATNNKVTNTSKVAEDNPQLVLAEAMIFGSSKSIEMSEKKGQLELCRSEVLPIKFLYSKKEDLEKFGVVFGDVVKDDPIFQHVTLPKGWSIRPTEHSMWTELIDDKGRIRAQIFYKAAWYDRSAHISLSTRFHYSAYEKKDRAIVKDGDLIIWESEPFEIDEDGEPNYESRELMGEKAKDWLDENYPRWENVNAYWDGL